MNPQPFTAQIPQTTLDDLQERLAHTRWPDEIPASGWDYGTNLAYLQELSAYWRQQFDWRAQEQEFNTLPQFRVALDGLHIHFVHLRGKGPQPLPLILTHGWPSSFLEMRKVLPLLTDPAQHGGDAADAFDVIVPSLPGYGFSERPTQRGMTVQRIATLWNDLMTKALGYDHYVAAGGDIGGSVTEQLGVLFPDRVRAMHLTNVPYQHIFAPFKDPSPAEQQYVKDIGAWQRSEGAYAAIQSSKPQTLAYGLQDSPVGLAAWIVEKYRAWSDCGGDVERRFTKDELLTNITLYWVTETINSANRFYYDSAQNVTPPPQKPATPTGLASFPGDIVPAPRAWAERWFNVQRWSKMPRGGHFAASEEPALLVDELRAFFRAFRS